MLLKIIGDYTIPLLLSLLLIQGCNTRDRHHYRQSMILPERYDDSVYVESIETFRKIRNGIERVIRPFGFTEGPYFYYNITTKERLTRKARINEYASTKKTKSSGVHSQLEGSDAEITIDIFMSRSNGFSKKYYFVVKLIDWSYPKETAFVTELKASLLFKLTEEFGYTDLQFENSGIFILNN